MADGTTIQIEVRDNAAAAAQSLERLAASLEKVKAVVSGGIRLKGLANQLANLSNSVSSGVSDDALGRLERLANVLERLQGMGAIKIKIPKSTERVAETLTGQNAQAEQQPVQTGLEHASDAVQTTNRLSSLMESLRNIAQATGRGFSAFGSALGALGGVAGRAVTELRPLVQAFAQLGRATLRVAGAGIRSMASGIARTASAFGKLRDRISFTNSGLGKLISSIKRVVMYRVIRSAIKAVTDGLKTGTSNLYQYSKAMGTSFAKSMDTGASASLKFKNSIAAMLSPAIQAAIPLLVALANAAITAANAIQQVFAVLTGASVWYKATDAVTDYENAAKGAGGATKNLLADWDELNVIQSKGGGGGGGAMKTPFSQMFSEENLPDNEWTRMAKDIKAAIESGDWYSVGAAISARVNGLIDQMKPDEWAKKLSDWLKNGLSAAVGLLQETDFQALGAKLGAFLMGIFGGDSAVNWELIGQLLRLRITSAVNTLAVLFSTPGLFEGIGSSFATLVNSFMEIDVIDLAQKIAQGINGAIVGARLFIKQVNFDQIATKIGGLLITAFGGGKGGIDWATVGATLKEGLTDIIGSLQNLFEPDGENAGLFTSIGGSFAATVNSFFNMNEDQKATITKTLNAAIKDAIGGVERFFADTNWDKIGEDIAYWLENIDWEGIADRLWSMVGKIFAAASTIGDYIVMGIINSIGEAWNKTDLSGLVGKIDTFGDVDAFRQWFSTGNTSGLVMDENGKWISQTRNTEKYIEELTESARAAGQGIEQVNTAIMAGVTDFTETVSKETETAAKTVCEGLEEIGKAYDDYDVVTSADMQAPIHITPVADIDSDALGEMNYDEVVSNPISTYFQSHKEEEIPVGFEFQPIETAKADLMVQDLYEQLRQAINAYDPESADVSAGRYFNETLSPIIDGIIDASGLMGEAAVSISDALYESWNSSLYDEDWEGSTEGLLSILSDAIAESVPDTLPAVDVSPLTTSFQNAADSVKKSATEIISAARAVNSISIGGGLGIGAWSLRPIAHFASGGYPTAGSLFIANEAGPEFVGTMGGKTAVANNDQIVSGVASGVAAGQAEQNALLRQQNQLLTQMLNKEFTAKAVPGADWGRFIHQSNSAYERQTGR